MRLVLAKTACAGLLAGVLSGAFAAPALADLAVVTDRGTFMKYVKGKTLSRPLVKLRVDANGAIRGTGAAKSVSGNWTWKNGYFCRDLYWGDDALGYNCQEVRAEGNRIRFTSDRGSGDSAEFRLR